MGFHELSAFLKSLAAVRDEAALQLARQAGTTRRSDPTRECFKSLAHSAQDRERLADLMLRCSEYTLMVAAADLEERIGRGELTVTVTTESGPYTVEGTDMLSAWFGTFVEELSRITPQKMLDEIDRVERGGPMSPLAGDSGPQVE